MKKCPKCKAEIQEEARFCLYCMTSFEEKQTIETPKENNKRWLYIIAAVLALVLIVACIFLFSQKEAPTNGEIDTSSNASISSALDTSDDNTSSSGQQSSESQGDKTSTLTAGNQTSSEAKGTSTDNTTGNTTSGSNSQNSTTSNNSSGATANRPTSSTSSVSGNASSKTTESIPKDNQPKYTYIEATIENTYPKGYSAIYAPENAIVITRVNHKEQSGNYIIPETIDGKKVAAIMPSAFSDLAISSSVKSISLPSTVRTIWSDAFKNCYNLTDLYLKSTVIEIYKDAFPTVSARKGELTIHCKKDCRNFDFYYYRNIATSYDAKYAEWNG